MAHARCVWSISGQRLYGLCLRCTERDWHFTCRDAHHTKIFYYPLAPRPSPPPPYQPHPSPSVLKGLLAAHEAGLEVKRAGPDPLVSPRLKGSDYMEN